MPEWLLSSWQWLSAAAVVALDLYATAHVILHKRDVQAAIGWAGLIWFAPGIGPVLYYLLGVNRVERKARRLKRRRPARHRGTGSAAPRDADELPPVAAYLAPHARLVGHLTGAPLLGGNAVRPLTTGTEAYAEMLRAIDGAAHTVGLSTYIFDNDAAGARFVEALGRAAARGVAVRVLIDDIGARYSWPRTVVGPLRRAGVQVARFLPQYYPWYFAYANLRSHRKILVVDGAVGFTGGMNIRAAHDPTTNPKFPVADLHFRLDGPVVAHLREAFADDWEFCTRAALAGRVSPVAWRLLRAGRRIQASAGGAPRRPGRGPDVGAGRHAVLPAGRRADRRAERGRPPRREGRCRTAGAEQPAPSTVGVRGADWAGD
jgi:cardiolipin synthase